MLAITPPASIGAQAPIAAASNAHLDAQHHFTA